MYGISKITSASGLVILLVPVAPVIWMGTSNAINSVVSRARVEERKIALQENEQTIRDGIEERQQTLNIASKAGAYTRYRKVTLENYVDSPELNPEPSMAHYKAGELILFFDKNGVCVGRGRNGIFEWKYWYQNACSNTQRISNQP